MAATSPSVAAAEVALLRLEARDVEEDLFDEGLPLPEPEHFLEEPPEDFLEEPPPEDFLEEPPDLDRRPSAAEPREPEFAEAEVGLPWEEPLLRLPDMTEAVEFAVVTTKEAIMVCMTKD
mmetsp:Transcript_36795/g.78446  ORF Transcript_36795/g.78446 Transcript_36795/m.78446 type:complete len:120 (-) Transcript_36795:239-598(-)